MTNRFIKSPLRSKVAIGLSLAVLSAVPSIANADALAQAILNITNFQVNSTGTPSNGNVNGAGQVDINLNGVNATTGLLTGANYAGQVALGAGYVPNSPVLGAPTGTYAGGRTSVTGNAIVPLGGGGANALADGIVSLVPQGNGASATITGTTFDWQFTLANAAALSFSFKADLFLRSFLDGNPLISGSATARSNWSITIDDATGTVFEWVPNGLAGPILGGTETLDPFNLNRGVTASALLPTPNVVNQSGFFAASTNLLAAGAYTLTINHKIDSNARVAVPEPGTLALVGLSLLGLGVVGRRRLSKTAA